LKKLFAMLLAAGLALPAWADEAALKKAVEAAYPKFKVQSVTKTPFPGLYEVYLGGQIIYTDADFSFLIAEGRLIDPRNRRDLTGERMEQLTRVDFATLPLAKAIKVVKGNGSRKIAVFSDPDCPYCKKLERNELLGIDNVTIYTFLYPIDSLHPDAASKSRAIWCAADRGKAWQEWILNDQLPKAAAKCDAPLDEVRDLGLRLGISSTPTLILGNGRRLVGAYPAKEIEKALAEAAPGK